MTHEKYNLDRPAVGLFFRSIWARQIFDVVFTIMVCVYYKIHHISVAVTYLASIRLLLAERMLYDLPISPSPRYFRHIAPLFLHATHCTALRLGRSHVSPSNLGGSSRAL